MATAAGVTLVVASCLVGGLSLVAYPGTAGAAITGDSLCLVSGSGQSAVVGGPYAAPLVVEASSTACTAPTLDATATGSVTFTVSTTAGGPSATFAGNTTVSLVGGKATSPGLTANAVAGTFTVAAASTPAALSMATFSLDNLATDLCLVSGSGQSAVVGGPYAAPLVVEASSTACTAPTLDATATGSVTFTVSTTAGGPSATFAGNPTVSLVGGEATSPGLTANAVAGTFTVVASAPASLTTVTFSLDNLAGSPTTITPGLGDFQSTAAGSAFSLDLGVTVLDQDKNPVPDVAVVFSAPGTGASGSFVTTATSSVVVDTDTNGVAIAPKFTANAVPGGYVVSATISGSGLTAAFALVNQATAPAPGTTPGTGGQASTTSPITGLDAPIVGMAGTPDGGGYWLVASDGGIFSFGDAAFHGSTGGQEVTSPVVTIGATSDGGGYALPAGDGSVSLFGDATSF